MDCMSFTFIHSIILVSICYGICVIFQLCISYYDMDSIEFPFHVY